MLPREPLSLILVAAAATGVTVFSSAYFIWGRNGSSNVEDDDELEDATLLVSREKVVEFFDRINFEQEAVMTDFAQKLAQFRGKVPDSQLQELATSQFEEHLAKAQRQMLDKMGIDEQDMEDASKRYAADKDEEIVAGMKRLGRLYCAVAGISTETLPDDLTEERMVMAVKAFNAASVRAIRSVMDKLIEQGKNLQDQATMIEMNLAFQRENQKAVDAALKDFGLNSSSVSQAFEKFQDKPSVQAAMQEGTSEQQKVFASYGMV